ncbi:MAG: ABC transporter permease [Candidatus Delongbacteria bacterium]
MNGWSQSWSVQRAVTRGLLRDREWLLVALVSPLFYLFFYGSAYLHKVEADLPLAVLDLDRSALSRTLVRGLEAHPMLAVTRTPASGEEARLELERGQVKAVLWIPRRLSARLKAGQAAEVELWTDASRFLPANDVNRAVGEVVGTLGTGVVMKGWRARGAGADQLPSRADPLRLEQRPLFNERDAYGDFLLPVLLGLILQQTLLIAVGLLAGGLRASGGLAEVSRRAGGRPLAALAGLLLPVLVVYAGHALFIQAVPVRLYGLGQAGSPAALLLLTLLFLPTLACLGWLAASWLPDRLAVLQLFVFSSYPLLLLSGTSWPLEAMPAPLALLARLLPGTPYLQALVRVTQTGAGLRHIRPELLLLAGQLLVYGALARWRLARQLRSAT